MENATDFFFKLLHFSVYLIRNLLYLENQLGFVILYKNQQKNIIIGLIYTVFKYIKLC